MCNICVSQEIFQSKQHNVFIEGLGTGGYYSLNYDISIYRSSSFRDFIRVGGCLTSDDYTKYYYPGKPKSYYLTYTFVFMAGTETGMARLKKEFSAGMVTLFGEPTRITNQKYKYSNKRYELGLAAVVGVRYYLKKYPIFLRACYTPLYSINQKKILPLWVGMAIGANF